MRRAIPFASVFPLIAQAERATDSDVVWSDSENRGFGLHDLSSSNATRRKLRQSKRKLSSLLRSARITGTRVKQPPFSRKRVLVFWTFALGVPLSAVFCRLLWSGGALTPGIVFAVVVLRAGGAWFYAPIMVQLFELMRGPSGCHTLPKWLLCEVAINDGIAYNDRTCFLAVYPAMASMTIRDLDERLKSRLRVRAAKNNRSMEEEVRAILKAALATNSAKSNSLAQSIRARIEPLGGFELDIVRREPIRDLEIK